MVNYRRNVLPGGTFFFTVTLADRRSFLLVEQMPATLPKTPEDSASGPSSR